MSDKDSFTFVISLSILDHLGRKLYRSFATVLGEAISNSWDADAENVWIYIDRERNSFVIKDDGDGMASKDFQNKFLKIGYSKRKTGETHSAKHRPYIGRKGIGKLALLSCAEKISVISKVEGGKYDGGAIDNAGLDAAITEDQINYPLGKVNLSDFDKYTKDHEKGTIIYFENMKDGIRSSIANIRKIIALYFRFSLLDKSFRIFVDDQQISLDDLSDLADRTEFLWVINNLKDPYVTKKLKFSRKNRRKGKNLVQPVKKIKSKGNFNGFIASVRKPMELKIMGTDERVGVDLFVNGRLRERAILGHIPTARVVESYLYGQIHFNDLDDEVDRFSTSREGVVADDGKFAQFLEEMKEVLKEILSNWDDWRRKQREEGDPDNASIPKRERKAEELYNVVSEEYEIPEDPEHPQRSDKVDQWVNELISDARYSFSSFAECFISENLVRKHIKAKHLPLFKKAKEEIRKLKAKEKTNMDKGNVSIAIRKKPTDTTYLSMDILAKVVDKGKDPIQQAALSRDASEYKPIRDALMHTALLTEQAKKRLSAVYENIKARVRTILTEG